MRITLVISTFSSGGAERAMSVMADHWANNAHEVNLITLSSPSEDFYRISSKVKRIGLGLLGDSTNLLEAVRGNLQRVKSLRREIRKSQPDAIISFLDTTNVLTLLATLGLGSPVIVCEQIDPRQYHIGLAWEVLRRLLYPRARAVVVVASAMLGWAEGVVRKDMAKFIPNPVALSFDRPNQEEEAQRQEHIIVAMGRLVRQKGFDLLLEAFARCTDGHPDWSLLILGEGEERERLEVLRAHFGIVDRVKFLGRVSDPAQILRHADLFVMSSRFEGFPLALIEAMACGMAVISTDCPTGPGEIIRDGVDGVLVPPNDLEALAAAMDRLMSHQSERARLALRAMEITERFGVEKVMGMWDGLLQNVYQSRRHEWRGMGLAESPRDN